jgi:protein TonB
MNSRRYAVLTALALAACAEKPPAPAPAARAPSAAVAAPAADAAIPAFTVDGYKKEWARKVSAASAHTYSEPVPEMLKSIVVLEVTIDRDGALAHVAVRRSNGFKALENRALESVRHAAPYGAPSRAVRGGSGSIRFLETFLFRDDGRFRIRSLVE